MKRLSIMFLAVSSILGCGGSALYASPNFVTPEMMLRNGLTDEQYELLWKQGKNPRIDPQAARDWIFRASRYENTTNWFGLVGRTNDFARMAFVYATNNTELVATNAVLSKTVVSQSNRIERLEAAVDTLSDRLFAAERRVFELDSEMTNGVYAIDKTDRLYQEREDTAPDEKLKTIYHEVREYLDIIRREFLTPPNKD